MTENYSRGYRMLRLADIMAARRELGDALTAYVRATDPCEDRRVRVGYSLLADLHGIPRARAIGVDRERKRA
jgi:hypothetical protein